VADAIALDPRLAELGFRVVPEAGADLNPEGYVRVPAGAYHQHRIALGIPEGGVDFAYGDAFPHDADLDQLGGVAFAKGCYVGQEVVSRMQHRGTARRRIIGVSGEAPLPVAGSEIVAAGRAIGTLGSSAGMHGLALIRLDRAKAAIDAGEELRAGDVPVHLSIPTWAKFGWPASGGDEADSTGRETGCG
jgi:folate-binding protein YgfZ